MMYQLSLIRIPLHSRLPICMFMISVLFITSISLGACSSSPTKEPNQTATNIVWETESPEEPTATLAPTATIALEGSAAIINRVWELNWYGSPNSPVFVPEEVTITLEFNADGQVIGSGGCNNYSSAYEIQDGEIYLDKFVSTSIRCNFGMETEYVYFQAIQAADSYELNPDGGLEIIYGGSAGYETRLIFTEVQKPWIDTLWTLQSIRAESNLEKIEPWENISAVFTTQEVLLGAAGCSGYSALYSTNEGTGGILVDRLETADIQCPDEMMHAKTYLDMLPEVEKIRSTGSHLQVSSDEGNDEMLYSSNVYAFENTIWTLIALNGGPIAEEAPLTLQFIPDEGLVTGHAGGIVGCDDYMAEYTRSEDGAITIDRISTTQNECSAEVIEIEQSYLNTLNTAESYMIIGDKLVLNSPLAILIFDGDSTPLEGPLWLLRTIMEDSNIQTPVEGSDFTAKFIHDPNGSTGTLRGTTGCNDYLSTYVDNLAEFKINPFDTQENEECSEELTQQEEVFIDGLRTASTYQIYGNILLINFGTSGKLIFFATHSPVEALHDLTALKGTFWFLKAIGNRELLEGTYINAQFDIKEDSVSGTVSGFAGCNSYQFEIEEGFTLAGLSVTEMFCEQPAGVMDQEQLFLDSLSTARSYSLDPDQLIIFTNGEPLIFSNQIPSTLHDSNLLFVNRIWYLTSINNNSVLPSIQPSALFNVDGTLSGSTGCNLYSARYSNDLDNITIFPIAKTEIDCGEAISQQEIEFINALQDATNIRVQSTILQLVGINGILNFSVVPPTPQTSTPTIITKVTETPSDTSGSGRS